MNKILVAVLFSVLFFSLSSSVVQAEEMTVPADINSAIPKVTISVAEGYVLLLKNGVTPGGASTRFGLRLSWSIAPKWFISGTIGISVPNDTAKVSPRVILGLGYAINKKWSVNIGILYQVNPGYGDSSLTNTLGVSAGFGVKLGAGFGFGLHVGAARSVESGSYWGLLIQPGVSYTF